jgi:predicted MFS family arabinose efflux permease
LLTTIAAFFDWRGAVFAVGVLALGLTVLLWRQLRPDGVSAGPAPRLPTLVSTYASLRQHPPTLALAGQSFVGTIGTYAAYSYLGAYFVERHGSTTQDVGWSYLVVGIGVVLGTQLVGGRLGAHLQPVLLVTRIAGGLLIGGALILPLPMLVVVALMMLGTMAHTANQVATAVMLVGESPAGHATTITLNNSALSFGIAAGGSLGGLALAVGDYPAVGVVSMVALLSAAGLTYWFHQRAVPPRPLAAGL